MVVHLVIGTRPQYVKWAALHPSLTKHHDVTVIDTGQHYDDVMTSVFLRDFKLSPPDVNLSVGSGSPSAQIGTMMMRLEHFWSSHRPDFVIVVGDTNSTLAAALSASKLGFPIGHVEAGIRSFNRSMSEELNRVITDHLSTILWCPTKTAVTNLRREGIHQNVIWTGDVMYELLLRWRAKFHTIVRRRLGLRFKRYGVLTIHRAANIEDPKRLQEILSGLRSYVFPIVFPVHPRTNSIIQHAKISIPDQIITSEPLGYLSFLGCIKDADVVVTDSGGLMREAAWLGVPVVVTRDETEWPELVQSGWNVLVGTDASHIASALHRSRKTKPIGGIFGDRHVSTRIVQSLTQWFRDEQTKKHAR